jgi:AcrR family transcriptional regulator
MHSRTGLRERKKDETRQAIIAAALELAVARGPAAVTVEEIALAANVSARTVFNYFPTKEAAILGIDPDRRRELVDHLESRPDFEPPLEALREAYRGMFSPEVAVLWRTRSRLVRDYPYLQSTYLAAFSGFETDLTEAIAHRIGLDPAHDPYPRLVVAVAATAMRVAVDHGLEAGRDSSIGDIIDDAFSAIASGLSLPPPPLPSVAQGVDQAQATAHP